MIRFGPFTFDPTTGSLWRREELLPLLPKDGAVLAVLVQQAGQVVLKETLLEAVWPETYVTDTVLKNSIVRLRRLLGDDSKTPHYIATRARRGYRFLATVDVLVPVETEPPLAPAAVVSLAPLPLPSDPLIRHASVLEAPEAPVSSRTGGRPGLVESMPIASPQPLGSEMSPVPPASRPNPAPPVAVPEPATMTERRHLTVLSCALADADTLALHLDPEDHYDLMQTFRITCRDIVASYDGYVAQQFDDGVLVYFGYPQAHEDDAQRAVRSGLALVERLRRGALRAVSLPESALTVQVGIATGMMIVSAGQAPDAPPTVGVGSASTLAGRLRALAAPGTVVISAATAQVVAGYFECKALEDVESAASASLVAYEVRGESTLQTRLDVGAARGLTPFVGREAEVALLQERWAYAHEGLGQMVLVQGEAGMGKSRLVQAWKEWIEDELSRASECRCSPYHQHTALYPLIDLLQRALYGPAVLSPAERLERLEAWLRQYDLALTEAVPLLAALLSLPLPAGHYVPLTLTPQRQRECTLEMLVSLCLMQTASAPMLLVVEDVHWADPSTLEFLRLLLGHVSSEPILVVLTARPEFTAPWGQRSEVTPVVLHRLTRMQTERMITQVTAGKPFPAEVMQLVVEKTDGIPLFVEELTRMVVESGQLVERQGRYALGGQLAQLTIPATLHDSLMARLDRLDRGKDIAQWGAVLGREFSYALLAAVTSYDEAVLQAGLGQLVEAELLFQRGLLPQTRYRFKHALIQEAAYDSLVKRRRQAMHEQVAQGLEAHFPELVETPPELLAHHYTEAGLNAQALVYWQRAGQRAIQRSAHAEAISHLRRGLEALKTLPDTPERVQQELAMHLALGTSLLATKGHAAPEVEQTYGRARELCLHAGDTPLLGSALMGLYAFHLARADLHTAYALGEDLLSLAQKTHNATLRIVGFRAQAAALFYLGQPGPAQAQAQQGMTLYDAQQHHELLLHYGQDPGMYASLYGAMALWMLGYPDQARRQIHTACDLAQTLAHPFTLTVAHMHAAWVHHYCQDVEAMQAHLQASMVLASEQDFAFYHAMGTTLWGWTLVAQGHCEEGLEQLRHGYQAYQTTGGLLLQPWFLGLTAVACREVQQGETGLRMLSKAFTLMEATDERWFEPELYRLQGEFLLTQNDDDDAEAETCLRRALTIARCQQARSWELRAALSLARLWQRQDKHQNAYNLLAPVYGWFTEGFDTADLQEAGSLLEDLS